MARCSRSAASSRRRSSSARFRSTTAACTASVSSSRRSLSPKRSTAPIRSATRKVPKLEVVPGSSATTARSKPSSSASLPFTMAAVALPSSRRRRAAMAAAAVPPVMAEVTVLVRDDERLVALDDGQLGPLGSQELAGAVQQRAAVLADLDAGDGVGGEGVGTLEPLVPLAQVGVRPQSESDDAAGGGQQDPRGRRDLQDERGEQAAHRRDRRRERAHAADHVEDRPWAQPEPLGRRDGGADGGRPDGRAPSAPRAAGRSTPTARAATRRRGGRRRRRCRSPSRTGTG